MKKCESNIDVTLNSINSGVLTKLFWKGSFKVKRVILGLPGIFLSLFLCAAQADALENVAPPVVGDGSDYLDSHSFGFWNSSFPESHIPRATTSEFVSAYAVDLSNSDYIGFGHTSGNGDSNRPALGFGKFEAKANRYDTFESLAGLHNIDADDHDIVGSVISVTAPVPEPETYAMVLVGLGLLGISARRRRSGTYN